MPLYEFVCNNKKCKKEFDEMCSFSEVETIKCPECKGKAKKKISIPTIAFKGSGFYKTDSVSDSRVTTNATPSTEAVAPVTITPTTTEAPKPAGFSKGKINRRSD